MTKIAVLSTERSKKEKDLGKMIDHLVTTLNEIEGAVVEEVPLSPSKFPSLSDYDHLIFCGYDHTTLGHIFFTLETNSTARITLYDEPGASPERNLGNLIFGAVDLGRMPASSTTRLLYSWAYRELVAIVKQDAKNERPAGSVEDSGESKPLARTGSRANRAR